MMQLLEIAHEIQRYIKVMRDAQNQVANKAGEKANAIRRLKKSMAIATIRLRNGEEIEIDGHKICNPPATLTKSIAEGMCADEFADEIVAESGYKEMITRIDSAKAILNGYQSLFKQLKDISKFD